MIPFVTRDTYKLALAEKATVQLEYAALLVRVGAAEANAKMLSDMLSQSNASHDHEMVRGEARYAELMTSYRQLRLQGYVETPVVSHVHADSPIDPIEAAINLASRGKTMDVRQAMSRQAEMDRKLMTVEQVVLRIQQGSRPADDMQ